MITLKLSSQLKTGLGKEQYMVQILIIETLKNHKYNNKNRVESGLN